MAQLKDISFEHRFIERSRVELDNGMVVKVETHLDGPEGALIDEWITREDTGEDYVPTKEEESAINYEIAQHNGT